MTVITIFQDPNDTYRGFSCSGHAGYARAGEDIVCSAISVLTINTINSISSFTDARFSVESDEETGYLEMLLETPVDGGAELLMKSLVLGLQGIQDNYQEYITLNFKEV
ncbi:MAG: ribosomal-processing cysteine protease Prp [Roseburia sp.]|nr:ribosomal-processing cysteine protease Prp [Roseburia sp.]